MPYLGIIILLLWVAALVDVIVADEYAVRHLPKVGWLIIVILIPLAGSIVWLLVGRPIGPVQVPHRTTGFPEYERQQRPRAVDAARDEEEFRRQFRERAEEQRRRARELAEEPDPDDPAASA
ncbi:PLD nuclease N-terminal domain-containing protein [Gordonia shandongensis]|uniref:PLD nuclease N-terminal domain-containing protein n=1 Tax=Gordonia shandongensis TaxID=376351 RepID=UPI00041F045D|nr:PLD nuclease N-terminal domain-containing protein [Gordonia shandongensis]